MNYIYLNPISTNTLLIVLGIVAVLAVAFAVFIMLVSKLCAVPVDEKTDKIKEQLAGANCGGCGFAGCADFAKALAEGRTEMSNCSATSAESKKIISEILGIPYDAEEQVIAVVHCSGGDNCKDKFEYVGNGGCAMQSSFMGGKKACSYGCLGGGTCSSVCQHNAVTLENGVAVTNKNLCESCGLCKKNCPKHLIGFIPKSAVVYVACSSLCKGKDVMNACSVGCIGCGLCAKSCPQKAIEMVNNYPVIDYKKCTGCKSCIGKCPRKSIKEV